MKPNWVKGKRNLLSFIGVVGQHRGLHVSVSQCDNFSFTTSALVSAPALENKPCGKPRRQQSFASDNGVDPLKAANDNKAWNWGKPHPSIKITLSIFLGGPSHGMKVHWYAFFGLVILQWWRVGLGKMHAEDYLWYFADHNTHLDTRVWKNMKIWNCPTNLVYPANYLEYVGIYRVNCILPGLVGDVPGFVKQWNLLVGIKPITVFDQSSDFGLVYLGSLFKLLIRLIKTPASVGHWKCKTFVTYSRIQHISHDIPPSPMLVSPRLPHRQQKLALGGHLGPCRASCGQGLREWAQPITAFSCHQGRWPGPVFPSFHRKRLHCWACMYRSERWPDPVARTEISAALWPLGGHTELARW